MRVSFASGMTVRVLAVSLLTAKGSYQAIGVLVAGVMVQDAVVVA